MMAYRWKVVRSGTISTFIVSLMFVGRATGETETQCRDILQQALTDKNPETGKHALWR